MAVREKVAAEWWAGQLKQKAASSTLDAVNDAALAGLHSLTDPLTDEQIAAFAQSLERILTERDARDLATGFMVLVDYRPDNTLSDAANAVDIDLEWRLPTKTRMYIYSTRIEVKVGYGAPSQEIWTAD